jgi:hypothetical protein
MRDEARDPRRVVADVPDGFERRLRRLGGAEGREREEAEGGAHARKLAHFSPSCTNLPAPRRTTSRALAALLLALVAACSDGPTGPRTPAELTVPPITREFRGMWIATVANIDWPQTAGLSASAQQQQLTQLLDIAQQTGINAVILQVRAAGDALYPSGIEPLGQGAHGRAGCRSGATIRSSSPSTKRTAAGWSSTPGSIPSGAANLSDTAALAATHFARQRPDLTRVHCTQLWFDPGEPEVHDRAIAVIRDVVLRYEIDAVHIDDFFYPYPSGTCPGLDFADSATYARYVNAGGLLARADWRRDNVKPIRAASLRRGARRRVRRAVRCQSVRYLAPRQPRRHHRPRRVRDHLRRLAPLAAERLGGLPRAPTLLVHRLHRPELPRAPRWWASAERATPALLARPRVVPDGRRHRIRVRQRRDPRPGDARARASDRDRRCDRHHPVQREQRAQRSRRFRHRPSPPGSTPSPPSRPRPPGSTPPRPPDPPSP